MRAITILAMYLIAGQATAGPMAYSVASDNFTDFEDHLVEIDLATGEFTSRGSLSLSYSDIEGLALAPDGKLYGADDATKTLIRLLPEAETAFSVSGGDQNLGLPTSPQNFGMTFACDEQLYLVAKFTEQLYRVNTTSGLATPIGSTGQQFTALAAWGDSLYSVDLSENTLYQINPQNASTTAIGKLGGLGGGQIDFTEADTGLSFDANGQLWMVMDLREVDPLNPPPSRIFTVSLNTGIAQLVSESLVGLESLAIAPPGGCGTTGVPQPLSIPTLNPVSLALLGVLMLMLLHRHRRRLFVG